MSQDRDARGRFLLGNSIAESGWHGRVKKQFGGDYFAARAYIADLGRHVYFETYGRAKQDDRPNPQDYIVF